MVRPDEITTAVTRALDGMDSGGPDALLATVGFHLRKSDVTLSEEQLVDVLLDPDPNAPERVKFHLALATWDKERPVESRWNEGTAPTTKARRSRIHERLELGAGSAARIDAVMPVSAGGAVEIVDPDWNPWYTSERRQAHSFYWNAYRKVLALKLDAESIAEIDAVTTDIVGRLADPAAGTPYQSKGLVVGHVQSGKTANFTGVIAKAIDAGYRLIIVLAGTIDILRTQTQRRLDMELVGRENILGGVDELTGPIPDDMDYAADGDVDWRDDKFVRLGIDVSQQREVPSIIRLTGKRFDYKNLQAGISALDFRRGGELADPAKPVWDEVNLFGTDVRLAVVKKHKTVLEKLADDIARIHARHDELPVLIIDDEADQASVNTTKPGKRDAKGEQERTAINGLIARLMRELSRSQYIGYTATPFANVFISPDDSEDVFPKDFIFSLTPPDAYMGGQAFHDLDEIEDGRRDDPGVSNRAAFVRDLRAQSQTGADDELRGALDMFVLSGAVKLWREARDRSQTFAHHTMLVHESIRTAEHRIFAERIRDVWRRASYGSPATLRRLRDLFEADVRPVSSSRDSWNAPLPADFSELVRHVGEAVDRILREGDPVVVVNGDKDLEYEQVDFQAGPVWRILVGGQKLSRGFTVEGLTVTYYRRKTNAADSLMQMGRWFGYRAGYQDLVRLFIDRESTDRRGKTFDLYEAFEAIVRDEEQFREQLAQFAAVDEDGRPPVRPFQVPPLVFQQLPWLKPTSANKMYNAEIDFMGTGAVLTDFPRQPDRGSGAVNRKHFGIVSPWLAELGSKTEFEYRDGDPSAFRTRSFQAKTAIIDAERMLTALDRFEWMSGFDFGPTSRMIRQAMQEHKLDEWVVLVPYLGARGPVLREVDGHEIPVLKRTRRLDRGGFSGSSFRQRGAVVRIAGGDEHGGPNADALHTPTRGAMLLTFAADPKSGVSDPAALPAVADASDIATIFSFALPADAAPRGRVAFRVKDASRSRDAIVPVHTTPAP